MQELQEIINSLIFKILIIIFFHKTMTLLQQNSLKIRNINRWIIEIILENIFYLRLWIIFNVQNIIWIIYFYSGKSIEYFSKMGKNSFITFNEKYCFFPNWNFKSESIKTSTKVVFLCQQLFKLFNISPTDCQLFDLFISRMRDLKYCITKLFWLEIIFLP